MRRGETRVPITVLSLPGGGRSSRLISRASPCVKEGRKVVFHSARQVAAEQKFLETQRRPAEYWKCLPIIIVLTILRCSLHTIGFMAGCSCASPNIGVMTP